MAMDMVGAITGLQRAETLGRVQMAVARKVLDQQELRGAAAIRLIEAAGGGAARAGDRLVAAATGLGGNMDLYA